jgi:phospholipid transport system substrate-binding protein
MTQTISSIRRRGLLGLVFAASAGAVPMRMAAAADASVPVQQLNTALLVSMKAGSGMSFAQRFATLTPVLEQTFDLDAVLAASIGLSWPTLPNDQKAQLLAAFRRYTVASYAANFNSDSGQTFQISGSLRSVGDGEVVVPTKLVSTDGSAVRLDYVMRDGPSGWKAVDVLADGSISRVAVQRSDFRHLMASGGVPALMVALEQKVSSLSGGMNA